MPDVLKIAFVLGVFVLGAGLLVPTLIDATNSNTTTTIELHENHSDRLTDTLSVNVTDVSVSGSNATINFTNERTLGTNGTVLNVSEQKPVGLSGDTINVSLQSVSSGQATVQIEYPPLFGWDNGARVFMENIEILLSALGALMVIGLVIWGVRL